MAASGSVAGTCAVCQVTVEVLAESFVSGEAKINCKLCGTALVVKVDGAVELAVHAAARPKSSGVSPEASTAAPVPNVAAADPPDAADAAAAAAAAAEPASVSIIETAQAFEGVLENVAVPDVVQLICTSRKTGILTLAGEADGKIGSGKLVFSDGQIIGCEHPSRAFQVGKILVHMRAVTEEQIEQAAAKQRVAGEDRKLLVTTLVEMGLIDEAIGWKALEKLVQSTIVEAILWETGTFSFVASELSPVDSFRHVPDGMTEALGVDAQKALMEAVRIIDAANDADEEPTDAAEVDLESDLARAAPATAGARVTTWWRSIAGGIKARLRAMAMALPRPPKPFDRRPRWIGLAAGGVFLLVVIVLFFALGIGESGPRPESPVEDAATATALDVPMQPEEVVPGDSTTDETSPKKAVRSDRTQTRRAAASSSGDSKRKTKRKQRAKRKRNTKDAGSFFDAALQSNP